MLTSLIPMPVNSGLNGFNIGLMNDSFSDGNGQPSHCIAKRMLGRQKKMKGNEKKFGEAPLTVITTDASGLK